MKIDEKYFVPFLIVSAIITAIIIAFVTVNNRSERQANFKESIQKSDSLKYSYFPVFQSNDSLSIQSFEDKYVVVDFWATWTESFSEAAHQQLAALLHKYPDRLEVLAAVVEDKTKRVERYIKEHEYPFSYVNGTQVFNTFNVPGVPTQLVYAPGGELVAIFTGSAEQSRLDSLQTIITP